MKSGLEGMGPQQLLKHITSWQKWSWRTKTFIIRTSNSCFIKRCTAVSQPSQPCGKYTMGTDNFVLGWRGFFPGGLCPRRFCPGFLYAHHRRMTAEIREVKRCRHHCDLSSFIINFIYIIFIYYLLFIYLFIFIHVELMFSTTPVSGHDLAWLTDQLLTAAVAYGTSECSKCACRRLWTAYVHCLNARCWRKCKIKQSRRGRREELEPYVTRKTTTYKLPVRFRYCRRGARKEAASRMFRCESDTVGDFFDTIDVK